MWKNYVCVFKAGFVSLEDADRFRHEFEEICFDDSNVIKMVNGKKYEDNEFQSQKW